MIYLIFDYLEHGPEHQVGTTDENKVPAMLEEWLNAHGEFHGPREPMFSTLTELLNKNEPGEYQLGAGWGAVSLSIVKEWTPRSITPDPKQEP